MSPRRDPPRRFNDWEDATVEIVEDALLSEGSAWTVFGPWGEVIARSRGGAFVWEAAYTRNESLMQDLLATAREEYTPDGRWVEPGKYIPDLLEEAVRKVVAEFGGSYTMLEASPPLPPEAIP